MKVGDYAYFGAYGDFDNATLYKVKDIRKGSFCKEYVLTGPNGNEFTAYEDEVSPCANNVSESKSLTERQAKI